MPNRTISYGIQAAIKEQRDIPKRPPNTACATIMFSFDVQPYAILKDEK